MWRPLDLINDDFISCHLEKKVGVRKGALPCQRIIQRNVIVSWQGVGSEVLISRLAGTSYCKTRERLDDPLNAGFHLTMNVFHGNTLRQMPVNVNTIIKCKFYIVLCCIVPEGNM